MDLAATLNIRPHEVVAFVGGGGKTVSISRLARELAHRQQRIIITTTTRLGPWQTGDYVLLPIGPTTPRLTPTVLGQIQWRLAQSQVVIVVGEPRPDKLVGVNPDVVTDLIPLADSVLVEADGARTRSLKAPAPYEPVWPPTTSLAVAVVGIDAVGALLTEEYIHRPERVSAITGLALGQPITPAAVAQCVIHPEGLFARVPPHARRVVLINKVKTSLQLEASHEVVNRLASQNSLLQVIIADVSTEAVTIWT